MLLRLSCAYLASLKCFILVQEGSLCAGQHNVTATKLFFIGVQYRYCRAEDSPNYFFQMPLFVCDLLRVNSSFIS